MGSRPSQNRNGSIQFKNPAIEQYVSGEMMYVNQILRGRSEYPIGEDEKKIVMELDKATNNKVNYDVLYRSVDASSVFGNISQMQYENLVSRLVYNDNSRIVQQSVGGILNNAIGRQLTERGFMSTTASEQVAHEFGGYTGAEKPIVLRIETSGKARGYDVGKSIYEVSDEPQREVLLRRNTSYRVTGVNAKNGNIVVNVKLQ